MRLGLRKRVWKDAELSEALRDLDDVMRGVPTISHVVTDAVWSLPFHIPASTKPVRVLVSNVLVPDDPTSGIAAFPSPNWTWTGPEIRVWRADGFNVGTRYVITWELVS